MKTLYSFTKKLWLISFLFLFISPKTYATHAQSADITYTCLGGNQYQINLSFYRDCAGVNAPNTVNINLASASCNQNFNTNLTQLPGTGIDVTPICATMNTTCNGGNNPGVEEYKYQGIVNLPANCTDWVFSFTLCCRNNAINTINNPGNENIYVEAKLNNFDIVCNTSPIFSNPPVSFPCVGQTSCFNHGAFDPDGDSLYYSLIAPATGPNTAVTYIPGYSPQQPLQSNPGITFDPNTGDICMTPTLQEVTVLAVKVDEYRSGQFVGSVVRDIQLRTVMCNNTLPYTTGVNGTGVFSSTVCAGNTLNFNIPTFDADPGQTVSINWNNAIPNATFTSNGGPLPTGTFNWTPTPNDISSNPYCFTVTVSDDNCPFIGVQIYSFCITVTGFTTTTTFTNANCNASNGSATATPQGGQGPYTYQWAPNGGNNATANGLSAGVYTVTVTDALGCVSTQNVTVGSGSAPGNINITGFNVNCFGGNSGSLNANVNGGQPPYTYQWSNGGTTQVINNLVAGTYWVIVTTNNGCITMDTAVVTQPSSPVTAITTQIDITCFGGNDGSATAIPSGGTAPYTVSWNTNPVQNNATATNLTSGTYVATITDGNGCTTSQTVTLNQPNVLSINPTQQTNVTCFGGNNGQLSVFVGGGTGPYSYNWNNNSFPDTASISNLTAGLYLLSVTDANGCVANTQYNISEPNELSINVVNATHVSCNGLSNGSIQTSTTGGTQPYSYIWNPGMNTQPNINNIPGGYYVVAVTDNNGCFDTTGITITEPSAIGTVAQGSDTICPGQNATLLATGFGGVGNYTYQWSNNSTGATQTVSPNSTTTYSVIATDGNGCIGSPDSVIVLVNDINLVNLSVVPDTNICNGSSYVVSASHVGGIGNYTYSWNNGLGNGPGPFVVAPNTNTTYQVTLQDECGNTMNENITVNVEDLPAVYLTPQTEMACGEVELNLNNSANNASGSTYFWDFGDNTYSNLATPNKTYTQSGSYNVSLTVTSPYGCVGTGQTYMNITINVKPEAIFEPSENKLTMLNPEVTFNNYSTDANFYQWTFGDGNNSTQHSPIHTYQTDGEYHVRLIATNTNGCKDTAFDIIEIEPEYHFYIPNAFTPDNDGNNDIFTAVGEEIETFTMQIFNRWGELIYETQSLDEGWDGTTKGGTDLAMVGVYVYNIKLRDWEGLYHKFTGHVSLLR
jgi:gliding motility-associated-like protein